MNFLQLLARRLGQALAVLRDPDAGLLLPLPAPVVDPRVDADRLSHAAREQGRADGARYLFDGWSFGHDGEPADAVLEPEYVRTLRHRCESAIHEYRDRQRLTEARLGDLYLTARDAERTMRAARDRMARVAVRDQLDEEDSLRAFLHRRNINADVVGLPPLHHPVWEGEAPPMRLIWRVLLVCFLTAVPFEILRYVVAAHLPAAAMGPARGLVLTAAIAGISIICPLVSGQLFRYRHATGSDGVLAALTLVLLLPPLALVVGLGLLAARLSARGGAAGAVPAAGLTEATLVVVFAVVLLLACAMAYVLGLAQRHPFQEAFARSRRLRNRTIQLAQRMGTRINPDYRAAVDAEPDPDGRLADSPAEPDPAEPVPPEPVPPGPVPAEEPAPAAEPDPAAPAVPAEAAAPAGDRELAIRHAYLSAENAYYQGLVEAVADPTFTEAVLRRRHRRDLVPAGPAAALTAGASA